MKNKLFCTLLSAALFGAGAAYAADAPVTANQGGLPGYEI